MKKFLDSIICVILCGAMLCGCQTQLSQNDDGIKNDNSNITNTENIYATEVKYTAENDSAASYLEIAQRSQELFYLLEEHANAFVMDAYNYQAIDDKGTPLYTQNNLSLPIEIDAGGYSIRVSKNYFKFNPIETVTGQSIENQMVIDDNTLNILVPEQYRQYENNIIQEYQENFYFEKATAANTYNEEAGLPLIDIPKESLNVHIIYVKDGQKYFTYRTDLAMETQNVITDPIVSIYTGNIHISYAHSFMSQFVYFYSEETTEESAYKAILPYIQQCEAEASFQGVLSVKNNFSK